MLKDLLYRADREFAGDSNWVHAMEAILHRTWPMPEPVLIFRSDDVIKAASLRSILNNDKTIFIKLGVVVTMDKIFLVLIDELKRRLKKANKTKLKITDVNSRNRKTLISNIIVYAKSLNQEIVVIVDNTQCLYIPQLSGLICLILELMGVVRFVFLLPESELNRLRAKKNKDNLKFFLRLFACTYVIR